MIELRTAVKGDDSHQLVAEMTAILHAINPELKMVTQNVRKLVLLSIVFTDRAQADQFRGTLALAGISNQWTEHSQPEP